MRRGLLALSLIAACFSPVVPGLPLPHGAAVRIRWSFSMENTGKSGLSGQTTTENIRPVGCTPGTAGGELNPSEGQSISFTGYLAASQFSLQHGDGYWNTISASPPPLRFNPCRLTKPPVDDGQGLG